MANVIVKYTVKRRTVRKTGDKEVMQHFADFEQTIHISEANLLLLEAAIEGAIDAADGSTE